MKNPLLAALLLVSVAGCATTGTVQLKANQAFLTGQVALKSAQQTVQAVCSAPNRPEPQCDQAIDILHTGAQAEAAGYTAIQAGNSADLNAAVKTLTALPQQLVTLGILKVN